MMRNCFFILLCSLLSISAYAENLMCSTTDLNEIYSTKCYSFGDEFLFVSNNWPQYDNGDEKPEVGATCFEKYVQGKKIKDFTQRGIRYRIFANHKYCCKHEVFRTDTISWGDQNNDYINLSPYGNFGAFYSECFPGEEEFPDTTFATTPLQKEITQIDVWNLAFESSRSDAIKQLLVMIATLKNNQIPFKIYRKNGTVKYIGIVGFGLCMSKNGKKGIEFSEGPQFCK